MNHTVRIDFAVGVLIASLQLLNAQDGPTSPTSALVG